MCNMISLIKKYTCVFKYTCICEYGRAYTKMLAVIFFGWWKYKSYLPFFKQWLCLFTQLESKIIFCKCYVANCYSWIKLVDRSNVLKLTKAI